MGVLFVAVQESGWGAVPWGAVLTLVLVAFGVGLVLVRDKLRKPVTFVTSDEREADKMSRDADKREILMALDNMRRELHDLRDEVIENEDAFRTTCATKDDLNGFSSRIEHLERGYLALHDKAGEGLNRSDRALTEVAHLRENMQRLEKSMADISRKVEPIPELLGRLDEKMQLLLRRS